MNRPAHVEFGIDPSAQQVFQMSASDPLWAIFHRPGTHRYVVRIHDGKAQWRLDSSRPRTRWASMRRETKQNPLPREGE